MTVWVVYAGDRRMDETIQTTAHEAKRRYLQLKGVHVDSVRHVDVAWEAYRAGCELRQFKLEPMVTTNADHDEDHPSGRGDHAHLHAGPLQRTG